MRKCCFLSFLAFLILPTKCQEQKNIKCVSRDYGYGGTVCVCNETYCDTIEPLEPFSNDEFNLYISSKSGLRFQYSKLKFQPINLKNSKKIMVNPQVKYQKIYGFGGAMTDAAGFNIKTLSPKAREKFLASYFSPQGIEYNLIRVPIGGTDFSTRKYTLDDTPEDIDLKSFRLSSEDIELKIPILLEAKKLSKKPIHLIGTAWTAPPWMKTNNDYICFGLLRPQYYDLWSKYHIRFLEEYKKHGLKFWAITTGNEPTAGLLPYYSFNCMGWIPVLQAKWVSQYMGPRLKNSGFNETVIIAVDDQRFTLPWWPKLMFRNKQAMAYTAGIGVHWYWDNYFPYELLDWTHSAFPDKFILYTEACFVKEKGLPAVLLGSWKRGENYALNIINNINHYVGGWIDWNIALDLKGGPNWVNNVVDSPIIVNASAGEFYKQPMYYALGHFSKFVPEGSFKIQIKQSFDKSVKTVGFLTPENNIVIVLLNQGIRPTIINIIGRSKSTASFRMPEKSIATVIFKYISYIYLSFLISLF